MLEDLLARCAPADWLPGLIDAAGSLGVPGTLFALGLLGGFFHCAGMCGPFVLAQIARKPVIERLGDRWQLPYHLGRINSYALLGALAGGTSGALFGATEIKSLAALMLALGGLAFAMQAASGLGWRFSLPALPGAAIWGRFVARLALPFHGGESGLSGYVLGLVLGLLPCGLLWGALAVAAGTGRAGAGALAMASFAAGTIPALATVAWAGGTAGQRFRSFAQALAPPLLLLNAGFLFYFAWRAAL